MERPKELPVILGGGGEALLAKRAEAIMSADSRTRFALRGLGTAMASMIGAFAGGTADAGGFSLPLFSKPLNDAAKAQIVGRLNAFYRQRPRPWRPAGNRPRLRRRGPVYDKLARRLGRGA